MSVSIPLLRSSSRTVHSPVVGRYANELNPDHNRRSKGSKYTLLARIGTNRRFYVVGVALILLGAGLEALRAYRWPASMEQRAGVAQQFDTSKLAVLLEPRNEAVLVPVLQNFFTNLPPAWPVQMHTSPGTAAFLRASKRIQPYLASGKFTIVLLPNGGKDVHSGPTLSKYLASDSSFWDLLAPAEHLLFFQTDSILCSKSEFDVDDFLGLNDTRTGGQGYAWVGAVWFANGYPFHPWGGNGGLSIRRRSIMQEITNTEPWPGQAEDGYFSDQIDKHYPGYVLYPEQHTAMRFSFENRPLYAPDEEWIWQPHGVHLGTGWGPCFFQVWDHIRKLQEWCPEMNTILPNDCNPHREQEQIV